MTVRREIVPTGQARGARLVAKGNSRAIDEKSSPLASGPMPLAKTLVIAAFDPLTHRPRDLYNRCLLQTASSEK